MRMNGGGKKGVMRLAAAQFHMMDWNSEEWFH
jgi:hypothetical protein